MRQWLRVIWGFIQFLFQPLGHAEAWWGRAASVLAVLGLAYVAAGPSRWLEDHRWFIIVSGLAGLALIAAARLYWISNGAMALTFRRLEPRQWQDGQWVLRVEVKNVRGHRRLRAHVLRPIRGVAGNEEYGDFPGMFEYQETEMDKNFAAESRELFPGDTATLRVAFVSPTDRAFRFAGGPQGAWGRMQPDESGKIAATYRLRDRRGAACHLPIGFGWRADGGLFFSVEEPQAPKTSI